MTVRGSCGNAPEGLALFGEPWTCARRREFAASALARAQPTDAVGAEMTRSAAGGNVVRPQAAIWARSSPAGREGGAR